MSCSQNLEGRQVTHKICIHPVQFHSNIKPIMKLKTHQLKMMIEFYICNIYNSHNSYHSRSNW